MQSSVWTLICFLFCVTLLVGGKKFRYDYTFFPAIGGWLKYNEIPANFKEARLRCQMEGAVLASPLNRPIKYAMLELAKEKNNDCAILTGIHATFSRGDFASIEGIHLSKIPHIWAKDEPDNFKNEEDCLVLLHDGTMGDVRCADHFPYMCFKKRTASLVISECGTTDPEYTFDARTGSCYKFHRTPRTWSRAYMNCMAEGGYLTIINSDTEATIIKELFAKNPGNSMIGNFWKDVAFIGFHDWTEHGEWITIHGQTLKEAGYDKFSPGEPNNATTGEYCGAVYRSALLDDLWCENAYAFICEKDPRSLTLNEDDEQIEKCTSN